MNNYFSRKQTKKKSQKKKRWRQKRQRALLFLLVAALIFGSTSYIWLINDASTQGFVLHDLEARAKELRGKNKDLELKVRRLQALGTLEEKIEELSLVKVNDVEYITRGPSQVALNN